MIIAIPLISELLYNNSTSLALAGEKMETLAILSSRLTSDKPISGGLHMLTQSRLKELLHYNPDTGLFIRKKDGKEAKYINKTLGYYQIYIDKKLYYGHRLAWLYVYGDLPNKDIDHINGDGLDNRIENLRAATRKENVRNSKHQKNNTTGYKGVCYLKSSGKYRARIKVDYKNKHLGCFDTAEEAYKEYCKAAKFYFKEYANYGER